MGTLCPDVLKLRGGAEEDGFILYFKNARCLSQDEHVEEVLHEMDGEDWDAIAFNETWRTQKEEDNELRDGHRWLGSRGALKQGTTSGKHG
eukprot:8204316-Karenia_brevis.AAC.1